MIRAFLRRAALFPFALVAVHFLGYAYAHLIRPIRAFRNPYLAPYTSTEPLSTSYFSYIEGIIHTTDLGVMSDPWGYGMVGITEAIAKAALASFGLLGIALIASVIFGFVIGLLAARANPPGIRRWLTSLSTVGTTSE